MRKYRFSDIKKVASIEPLNLRQQHSGQAAAIDVIRKKTGGIYDGSGTLEQRLNSINLKPLQNGVRGLWCGPNQLSVDGISSTVTGADGENYHLVPRETVERPLRSSLAAALRLGLSGLLILIFINFFNIVSGGQQLKNVLVSSASSGFSNVLAGVDSGRDQNLDAAETEFLQAQGYFNLAVERLSFLRTSSVFGEDRHLKSLENLLAAGQSISAAGRLFAASARKLQTWPDLFFAANRDLVLGQPSPAASPASSLTDRLSEDLQNVNLAIEKLSEANDYLALVDVSMLPQEYRQTVGQIRDGLGGLEGFLRGLANHFPAVLELLGDRYPHRYLILLQNDTESRPTGGFIGSLMIVDINDGVITRADFHDVYQFDGQLHESIEAPEDIAMITDEWRLRDSNYSPDFALSAEKAAWFLQKSKGPSVDTVIAVNQSAISNLLASLGPLTIPELKSELDANNFQLILSYLVETKYYGDDNPKVILSRVIEAFKNKILTLQDPQPLIDALLAEIRAQKILFYSRDAEVQELFEQLDLTPHQAAPAEREDFLQVVTTSIGGNKSDQYIEQKLVHTTHIESSGDLINELSVSRAHRWNEEELSRWRVILKTFGFTALPEHFQSILGGGPNRSSVKVYVPLGSELEHAVGINPSEVLTRHDPELNRTYFLFFMEVLPGEESKVVLRYRLPWRLSLYPADIYRFAAQRQLALFDSAFTKALAPSPNLSVLKNSQNSLEYSTVLRDLYRMQAVLAN